MLKTKLITKQTDFIALGQKWNSLLQKSAADNIFLTWEWISNWWKIFGFGKELRIPVFYQNSELVGMVPLYIRKRRLAGTLPLREICFLGCGETVRSDYMDIISLPKYRNECRDALLDYLIQDRTWDIANFKDLRDGSSLLSAWPKQGLKIRKIEEELCYYVKMPASYDDYLSRLGAKMRRNIRNRQRNLERDFTSVEFRVLQDREDLANWMEIFKSLHMKRMSGKGLAGKFSIDDYDHFHTLISEKFFDKGWLFAADLRLDGKPIACRYNFIYNNKIYDYQTGFDPHFGRNGVMQALISYIIDYAIRENIREFDFLAGEDDYKRRFANAQRKISTLKLLNNTTRGKVYSGLQKIKRIL